MRFQSSLTEAERIALSQVAVNEANIGVAVFDKRNEQCVFINRFAVQAIELAPQADHERIPLKTSELFPTESRSELRRLSLEMLQSEGYQQNILMRKSNGMVLIANVGVRHVAIGGGNHYHMLMFEDITIQRKLQREVEVKQDEIKKTLNEILEQNAQLKELDHAKDRFIALTTHELRTPLSAIVATAEVLQLKFYESDEQRDDFIKTIYEQGIQLMELVNDILDFAKIRAGKMEFYVEQMDFVPLVTKLVSGYEQMAAQQQIQIETKAPNMSLDGFADSLRLKEVITNVVSNAIKYNRSGGRVDVTFCYVNHSDETGQVHRRARITVSDTGPGIPLSKVHHVFNEFETVGHVNRHHKGTGLGMPISKRLMLAMGGDLTLESVEGEGTSFHIDIPTEKVLNETFYRTRVDSFGDLAA